MVWQKENLGWCDEVMVASKAVSKTPNSNNIIIIIIISSSSSILLLLLLIIGALRSSVWKLGLFCDNPS